MNEGLGWNGGGWGFILSPACNPVAGVLIMRWWEKVEVQDPVTGILTVAREPREKEIDQVRASRPYSFRVGDRVLIQQGEKGRLIFYLVTHQKLPSIHYGKTWGPKPDHNVRLSTLTLEAFACGGIDPRWEAS